ncbi:UPF0125 protein [Chitinimonas prasina]|uniref:UPF0125 protein GCM10007907_18150 n=1 Tax=Chitinimonas prasina TaxID=1434937 RepID=A0ABQ5YDI6_9NEIS|nr:RnfH family protein [Chitinimonas prasina]GLR13025.1 UPF0125 protein [Chitinimonas prasina]
MSTMIRIEVAYARPDTQAIVALSLPEGSTIAAAITASALAQRFPELSQAKLTAGVHGHVRALDTPLREGDRVEIYRPLIADPKDARHRRVALGKTMKRDDGA